MWRLESKLCLAEDIASYTSSKGASMFAERRHGVSRRSRAIHEYCSPGRVLHDGSRGDKLCTQIDYCAELID
jgi:hypothetical protein